MWKQKLQEVFGQNLDVKIDLFHAMQHVIKKYQKETSAGEQ